MNKANLYEPVINIVTGNPPVVIRTVMSNTPTIMSAGVPTQSQTIEDYVRIAALPQELRRQVISAIQAMLSGI